MGYGRKQMEELRETIARSDADLVLIGTPIDLRRVIELDKPALRVTYRLQELGEPTLAAHPRARGIIEPSPRSPDPPRREERPRPRRRTRRPRACAHSAGDRLGC